MSANLDDLKRRAAEKAVESIQSGTIVGLGTGSTANHVIRAIGQRLSDGRLQDILGIPTSVATAKAAKESHIPLTTLDDYPEVDLTIDGADEIDADLNLIKGLGGALLREKIVATASKQILIVGDYTKRVEQLGAHSPVPVEVIPFALRPSAIYLQSLGARVVQRIKEGQPVVTDGGNVILDCYFDLIDDPASLALAIRSRPGIVEHGLFLDIATAAIIASPAGVETLQRR